MATTSIWRVKGWLGKVVIYIENPDKTTNPAFYEKAAMTKTQAQGLSDVIEYAINNEKTQAESDEVLQSFVSGINCYPGTAREEMLAVKKQYGKEDGTVAYHGYQSFAPGEATPEIAHEIGVKLAQRLWGDRYQVIVATHLDHANHLHNHFVLNTVSFVDGLKYHRTGEDYKAMREASDALCREYGLSVIENPQPGKADHYAAWKAKQDDRPTWPGLVRDDVDEAIRQSMTMQQFWSNLKKRGYEVKVKKLLYLKPPGSPYFCRIESHFGPDYSVTGITERILNQRTREKPLPEPERRSRRVPIKGSIRAVKKATGFRALYFKYLYQLRKARRASTRSKTPFTLKEELLKFDRYQRQFRFLQESRISTETELSMYSDALQAETDALTEQRRELYRLRKKGDDSVSPEIERITARLRELRRTQRLCGAIQGDIPAIRAMSTLDDERESQHDDRSKAHEKTHKAKHSNPLIPHSGDLSAGRTGH